MRVLRLFRYKNIRRYLYILMVGVFFLCSDKIIEKGFHTKSFDILFPFGLFFITLFIAFTITMIIANLTSEDNFFKFDRYVLNSTLLHGANIPSYVTRTKDIDKSNNNILFDKYVYISYDMENFKSKVTRIKTSGSYSDYVILVDDNIFNIIEKYNIQFNFSGAGNSTNAILMQEKFFENKEFENYNISGDYIVFKIKNDPIIISKFKMLVA